MEFKHENPHMGQSIKLTTHSSISKTKNLEHSEWVSQYQKTGCHLVHNLPKCHHGETRHSMQGSLCMISYTPFIFHCFPSFLWISYTCTMKNDPICIPPTSNLLMSPSMLLPNCMSFSITHCIQLWLPTYTCPPMDHGKPTLGHVLNRKWLSFPCFS